MKGILAFGDSITFSRGDSNHEGWAGLLAHYFESLDYYNCLFNLGIPGDSSADLLKRFEVEADARIRYLRELDKFVILVGIGINDSRFNDELGNAQTEPEQFKKNIEKLIELSKQRTKDVVFIGLTPVDEKLTNPYETTYFNNERVSQFNDIIKSCCADEGVLFLDMFKELSALDYCALLDDGLHPNSAGYQKMYEIIKEFLDSISFLK